MIACCKVRGVSMLREHETLRSVKYIITLCRLHHQRENARGFLDRRLLPLVLSQHCPLCCRQVFTAHELSEPQNKERSCFADRAAAPFRNGPGLPRSSLPGTCERPRSTLA